MIEQIDNLSNTLFRICGNDALGIDLENVQVHLSGHGVGDSIRIGSIIKSRINPNKKQLVLVEDSPDLGIRVNKNFSFVDYVIGVPNKYWGGNYEWLINAIGKEEFDKIIEPLNKISPDGKELLLSAEDLRKKEIDIALPSQYVVIQPSSYLYKGWSLNFQDIVNFIMNELKYCVVIIGAEQDKVVELKANYDLRGKLSIEESICVVANSSFTIGVESWSPITASSFGKPGFMMCCQSSLNIHGASWKNHWKSLCLYELSDFTELKKSISVK